MLMFLLACTSSALQVRPRIKNYSPAPPRRNPEELAPMPAHLAAMISDVNSRKGILFDVREADEWARGHLAGAMPAPLSGMRGGTRLDLASPTSPTYGTQVPGTPPEDRDTGVAVVMKKVCYLHCAAGVRSAMAAALMTEMGYPRVALEVSDVATGEAGALIDG
jgi:rhodanese-related sulfurtransferase